ncbi:hypothetical protein EYF80_017661 [Liparis tanakae]|uniref:Uncharacterized protein n=1 Tax=Liparis tanakae TaxID=230148 RepID=A0A4Z2I445_9TELE|nr:hypothetical protein EYF80_017661 [Liparis tanakae]
MPQVPVPQTQFHGYPSKPQTQVLQTQILGYPFKMPGYPSKSQPQENGMGLSRQRTAKVLVELGRGD